MKRKKGWKYLVGGMLATLCMVGSNPVLAETMDTSTRPMEQPDGTAFEMSVKEDGHLGYCLADNVAVVKKGVDGYWYYETTDSFNKEETSLFKYGIDARPSNAVDEEYMLQQESEPVDIAPFSSELIAPKSSYSWSKEQKLLVLLVEFEDTKLTYDESTWREIMFDDKQDSLYHYFKEETGGLIEVMPANESNTTETGVVKVSLNYNHPFPFATGRKIIDERNQKIVRDALIQTDELIDYAEYDTNNNGKIEQDELHIMTIVAGYDFESATGPVIPPHQWAIYNNTALSLDGTSFLYYTQLGEKNLEYKEYQFIETPATGALAHEFGHDLGIPDLYGPRGLGNLSLMANDGGLDAYSKMLLGVPVTTLDLTTKDQIVTINAENDKENQLFKIPTDNPKEYFLIDNRQLNGYDASMGESIHGTGIGVYRINENFASNKEEAGNLVTVLEADEGILGYSNLEKGHLRVIDPFYYVGMGGYKQQQQTVLSKDTTPSTKLSDGSYADFVMEVLDEPGMAMRVKFSKNRALEGLSFGFSEKTIEAGRSLTVSPIVTPENATNQTMKWTSSDTEIATVDGDGKITAVKEGVTTIKVISEEGNKTAEFKLIVTRPSITVEEIVINQNKMSVDIGESKQAPVSLKPENAYLDTLNWTIKDTTVATVNESGKVTGKKQGQTKLTVSTADGSITKELTVLVGDDHMNTIEEATMMTLDEQYNGKINYLMDNDYFQIEASTDEYFVVESSESISTFYEFNDATQKWQTANFYTYLNASGRYYTALTKSANRSVSRYGFRFLGTDIKEYDLIVRKVSTEKPTIHNLSELNHRRMDVGDTVQIDATANNGIDPNALVYSSQSNVIEVSKMGEITAKKVGTTKITVRDTTNGTESSFTVYVDDHANVLETGTVIELEKTYTGKIEYSSDYDCFVTDIPANESHILEMATNQNVMLYRLNKTTKQWDFIPSTAVAKDGKYQITISKSEEVQTYGFRFLGSSLVEYEFSVKKENN